MRVSFNEIREQQLALHEDKYKYKLIVDILFGQRVKKTQWDTKSSEHVYIILSMQDQISEMVTLLNFKFD